MDDATRQADDGRLRRFVVLVVGMLAGPGAGEQIYRLSREQPSTFHFVVPTTVPDYGLTWTEAQARKDANQRLEIMLEFSRAMGIAVDGEVRNTDDPVEGVRAAVAEAEAPFDELVVIDRPRGVNRWLAKSKIDQLKLDPGLPIRHFEANPPVVQGKHFDLDELRRHFADFQRRMGAS